LIAESLLKRAHDWLANSDERGLRPGNCADSIDDLVRLGIDERFKKFFAARRMVCERSVSETESRNIISAADAVENTAPIQGPALDLCRQSSRVRDRTRAA
jgi:hypothetical protein